MEVKHHSHLALSCPYYALGLGDGTANDFNICDNIQSLILKTKRQLSIQLQTAAVSLGTKGELCPLYEQ
jgi:hypothetical protein